MKIRNGDTVVVISGKDKGKTGTVLRVLPTTQRIVVGGINMRTRHMKKTPQRAGQILHYEASIAASNVMLLDAKTKKRTRVGYTVDEKGRKFRIAKKSGEKIAAVKAAAKATPKTDEKKATAAKTKAAEKPAETTAAKDTPPTKGPFWKKLGFGADAVKDAADLDEPSRMQEDRTVPEQSKLQTPRSHSRGK